MHAVHCDPKLPFDSDRAGSWLSIGCAVDKKKPKMMMAPDSQDAAKDISRSLHVPRIGVR